MHTYTYGQPYSPWLSEETTSGNLALIKWDNDIFHRTDYYYTNGSIVRVFSDNLHLDLVDKFLRLPDRLHHERWALEVRQDIYTPQKINDTELRFGDRPYAGTLTMKYLHQRYSKETLISGSITIGWLGPYALSGSTQNFIHSYGNMSPAMGWDYQLANSAIVNIDYSIEKYFLQSSYFNISSGVAMALGSLRTNAQLQLNIELGNSGQKFGKDGPFFSSSTNRSIFEYRFYLSPYVKTVIYDATLEGGITSFQESLYTFSRTYVNPIVYGYKAGLNISVGKAFVAFETTTLSPEFHQGLPHKYGSVSLGIRF